MLAWALSPACSRSGSRPTLPDRDHGYPSPMGLSVPAQPAEKCIRLLPAFRCDSAAVVLEQPVDEDRQFVDGEHDRPGAAGERCEDRIAPLGPIAGVDSGPQLYFQVGD